MRVPEHSDHDFVIEFTLLCVEPICRAPSTPCCALWSWEYNGESMFHPPGICASSTMVLRCGSWSKTQVWHPFVLFSSCPLAGTGQLMEAQNVTHGFVNGISTCHWWFCEWNKHCNLETASTNKFYVLTLGNLLWWGCMYIGCSRKGRYRLWNIFRGTAWCGSQEHDVR